MFEPRLVALIKATKGFMPESEGIALYQAAKEYFSLGIGVEIGSYCGKSTLYLAQAAQETGSRVVTVDHHRGSEEHQIGWEYHDPERADADSVIDTLPSLLSTLEQSNNGSSVTALIGRSIAIARWWSSEVDWVFIDGSHSSEAAFADLHGWEGFVRVGGALMIHDVFPNPEDGGRPPFEIYQAALESGRFIEKQAFESLRVLERVH